MKKFDFIRYSTEYQQDIFQFFYDVNSAIRTMAMISLIFFRA